MALPVQTHPAGRGPTKQDLVRPQYIELKANVHKKLLNRLNLETLASVDRTRAESEIRTLLFDLIAEEGTPLSLAEREAILGDIIDEVFGLGPLEPLLRDPTDQRHSRQHATSRSTSSAPASSSASPAALPGRQAPDAGHRPDRVGGRPPRRRQLADGRRPPPGRLACQRDHPAARGGRSAALDSPVSGGSAARRQDLVNLRRADAADARLHRARRAVAPEHSRQRRYGRRKDDAAERHVQLHLRPRAHRDDRGRRRAAAAPGTRRRGSRRGRPTSRARARCASGSSSSTRCVCVPTASSSARSEAKRRSTCCRR